MKAMVFAGGTGVEVRDVPLPRPAAGEIRIDVLACGVCRTELDQIERRIEPPLLPVIPGHQAVGRVGAVGEGVSRFSVGDRAGAAWILSACGACRFCREGRENLCPDFRATGCHGHGGYAEALVIHEDFAVRIPDGLGAAAAVAPLLCAGAIGRRALDSAGIDAAETLGLFGFGSSNHLVLRMAKALRPELAVFVFTRSAVEQDLARSLGAAWAGGIDDDPPAPLDRAIDATPAWRPMLRALERLRPGGRLVVNAIRKGEVDPEELSRLDWARHLWMEHELVSVANVTRRDAEACLDLAAAAGIEPVVETYPLAEANRALEDLAAGRIRGSKVLLPGR